MYDYDPVSEFFFGLIIAAAIVGLIALFSSIFYDEGQISGYCTAVHGKVEDGNCVKGDTILKRGSDL